MLKCDSFSDDMVSVIRNRKREMPRWGPLDNADGAMEGNDKTPIRMKRKRGCGGVDEERLMKWEHK